MLPYLLIFGFSFVVCCVALVLLYSVDFAIPRYRTVMNGKHSIRYIGPRLWSKLRKCDREKPSLNSFRKSVRQLDLVSIATDNSRWVSSRDDTSLSFVGGRAISNFRQKSDSTLRISTCCAVLAISTSVTMLVWHLFKLTIFSDFG